MKVYVNPRFSKNKINQETLKLLRQLAKESALDEAINAMFEGSIPKT